jgi:hypothetical protein
MEVKVTKRLYRQMKGGFSLSTLSSHPSINCVHITTLCLVVKEAFGMCTKTFRHNRRRSSHNFDVFTVLSMKIKVYWDVTASRLVKILRTFWRSLQPYLQGQTVQHNLLRHSSPLIMAWYPRRLEPLK